MHCPLHCAKHALLEDASCLTLISTQGLESDIAQHLLPDGDSAIGSGQPLGGLAARLSSKVAKAEARQDLPPAPESALNFRPAVSTAAPFMSCHHASAVYALKVFWLQFWPKGLCILDRYSTPVLLMHYCNELDLQSSSKPSITTLHLGGQG